MKERSKIRRPLLTSNLRYRFRAALLKWYDENRRPLPWRTRKSLYRTWVSEIMLQQTQVATVVDYFERFVKRFPDIQSLAHADLQEVLQLWEGLGYYRRAKQLHAAARKIVHEHGGRFPKTISEALALPGVGRYTAGAILSIAEDQPHPILEGNTERLYSRLLNLQLDPKSAGGQKQLWRFAESLVQCRRPGDLNQALMELGSQICRASMPDCGDCPVNRFCQAYQIGDPASLPIKIRSKTNYEKLHEAAIVIRRRDRIVLRHCQPTERWANLWDFPRYALPAKNHQDFLCCRVKTTTGLSVQLEQPFRQLNHTVTRFRIKLDCYEATMVSGRLSNGPESSVEWVSIGELGDRPLNVTGRKIARMITRP